MVVWGYHPKTSLTFPVQQYWLGIDKPKNVFRLTLKPRVDNIVGIAPKLRAPPKTPPSKTNLKTYFGTKITFTK